MPRKDTVGKDKMREWERERRERLNECFNHLGVLLPDYDPAVVSSKVDILSKAASYIRNLQQENRNLLNGGLDESNLSQLKQLKHRVEELVKRTQQLAALLRDAGISIPSEVGTIAPRANQWSNKIRSEDAAGLLEKVRAKQAEDKKKNSTQRKTKTSAKPPTKRPRSDKPAEKTPLVNTSNIPLAKPAKKPKKKAALVKKPTVSQMLGLSSADLEVSDPPNASHQFIVVPSSASKTSCVVVTDPKASLSNLSLVLGRNAMTTPIAASRVVKKKRSESIMKTNPSLASLGPGTLILANGDIVPVIPRVRVADSKPAVRDKANAKKVLSKLVPKPRVKDISKLNSGKVAIPALPRPQVKPPAAKPAAAAKTKKKVATKAAAEKTAEIVDTGKTSVEQVASAVSETAVLKDTPSEVEPTICDTVTKTSETTVVSADVLDGSADKETVAAESPETLPANPCKRRGGGDGGPEPKAPRLDSSLPDDGNRIIDPNSVVSTVSPIEAIRNIISASTAIKTSNSGSYTIDALCKTKIPVEKPAESAAHDDDLRNPDPPVVSSPCETPIVDPPPKTTPSAEAETLVEPAPVPPIKTPDKSAFVGETLPETPVEEAAAAAAIVSAVETAPPYIKDKPIYSQSKIPTAFSDNAFYKSTGYSNYDAGNSFVPIGESDAVNVHSSLSIAMQNHEFSSDIFASLQVPAGGHHPESISPTAAFLLAFPLVSTSKVTEMIDSQEEAGSDSLQGTSTLLQIGNLDSEQSILCVRRDAKEFDGKSSEGDKLTELGFVDCVAKKSAAAPNPKSNIFEFDNACYPGSIPAIGEPFLPSISSISKYQDKSRYSEGKPCEKSNFVKTSSYSQSTAAFRDERNPFLTHLNANEVPTSMNQPCAAFDAAAAGNPSETQRSNYKPVEKCGANGPFYGQSDSQTYNYNLFHNGVNPVITSSSSNYCNVDKNIFQNLAPDKLVDPFANLPNVSQSGPTEKVSNPFQSVHVSQATPSKESTRKDPPFGRHLGQDAADKPSDPFRTPRPDEKTNPFAPPTAFQPSANPVGVPTWPPAATNRFATFDAQKPTTEPFAKSHDGKADCFTNIFDNERQAAAFERAAYKYPTEKIQPFPVETDPKNNQTAFKTGQNGHRPPVNWMTTPDNRQHFATNADGPQKQFDPWPSQNLLANAASNFNNAFYNNNFYPANDGDANGSQPKPPDAADAADAYPFNWNTSPRKATALGDGAFVPSTLPTLVGDLALGTNFATGLDDHPKAFTSGYEQTDKDPMKPRDKDGKRHEFPAHFLSVSQLVCANATQTTATATTARGQNRRNGRNAPAKPTRTGKRANDEEPVVASQRSHKDANRNEPPPYQAFGEQHGWPNANAKQRTAGYKAPVSNYSAEALIGHANKQAEPTGKPTASERFAQQGYAFGEAGGCYANVDGDGGGFQNQQYAGFGGPMAGAAQGPAQGTQFYPGGNYLACAGAAGAANSTTFLPEMAANAYSVPGLGPHGYPEGGSFGLATRGRPPRPTHFPATQRGGRRMPAAAAAAGGKKARRRDGGFAAVSPTASAAAAAGNSVANFNLSTIFPEINDKQSVIPPFGKGHMHLLPSPGHLTSLAPPGHNMSTLSSSHMSTLPLPRHNMSTLSTPSSHMSTLQPSGHSMSTISTPSSHMSTLQPSGHNMSTLSTPSSHMSTLQPSVHNMSTLSTPSSHMSTLQPSGHNMSTLSTPSSHMSTLQPSGHNMSTLSTPSSHMSTLQPSGHNMSTISTPTSHISTFQHSGHNMSTISTSSSHMSMLQTSGHKMSTLSTPSSHMSLLQPVGHNMSTLSTPSSHPSGHNMSTLSTPSSHMSTLPLSGQNMSTISTPSSQMSTLPLPRHNMSTLSTPSSQMSTLPLPRHNMSTLSTPSSHPSGHYMSTLSTSSSQMSTLQHSGHNMSSLTHPVRIGALPPKEPFSHSAPQVNRVQWL